MRKQILRPILALLLSGIIGATAFAQDPIKSNRNVGQAGLNQFETPKEDYSDFDGVKVKLGGDFALQFQGLDHSNDAQDVLGADGSVLVNNTLKEIQPYFNNATANMNIDVQLAPGVRMNLVTYLSSRHHTEAWVKGGYIQFDALPFLNSELVDKIMKDVTIKVGHMEINYGDAHFRRTDNGNAIYNPFVGNYIMDAFATEIGAEVYYRKNNIIGMIGVSNGEIKGDVVKVDDRQPSVYGKLGYDNQVDEDLRLRLTGSFYANSGYNRNTLYAGDRTGSRYYYVMANTEASSSAAFTTGRFSPGFNKVTSFMINPFVSYKGIEFFGTYEHTAGLARQNDEETLEDGGYTQLAADLLYRFGENDNFYIGGRYNQVKGNATGDADEVTINRYQIGAGWFLTNNILAKVEYVNQEYKDFAENNILYGGRFNGVMVEAVIGF
ncbi:hypothetical protein V6R21_13185 [Limibacter armeniacum]|uniref:hypothetical protein n=1 Tax=Limibacter armeniacum TaxID=466084 RepID=UPI002FE57F32